MRTFPDKKWLNSLSQGDRVLYCFQGSAGHIYPYGATVLRRGKTFVEIKIDRYSYPTKVSVQGTNNWLDTNYWAKIAPFESLREQVEATTAHRLKFNETAISYGLKPFEIPDFVEIGDHSAPCHSVGAVN